MAKGSYTLEAALVLPLVIIVMAALITEALWLHDRTVIHHILSDAAATENGQQDSEEEIIRQANQRTFLVDISYVSVVHADGNTEIQYKTDPLSGLTFLRFLIANSDEGSGKILYREKENPTLFLYAVRAVKKNFGK